MKKALSLFLILAITFIFGACGAEKASTDDPAASVEVIPVETELDIDMTPSQAAAYKSARDYLRSAEYSKSGLLAQLAFEEFSEEDALFAIEYCGADWMEQALKAALSYLEHDAFSYDGLKGILDFEGYTEEEVAYAMENCGADWMEQAVKAAENYLSFSSPSHDDLVAQLEGDGFTPEEALYGVEQNGL